MISKRIGTPGYVGFVSLFICTFETGIGFAVKSRKLFCFSVLLLRSLGPRMEFFSADGGVLKTFYNISHTGHLLGFL